jgi:hypothetical protein
LIFALSVIAFLPLNVMSVLDGRRTVAFGLGVTITSIFRRFDPPTRRHLES